MIRQTLEDDILPDDGGRRDKPLKPGAESEATLGDKPAAPTGDFPDVARFVQNVDTDGFIQEMERWHSAKQKQAK